jgi:TetR/AcrR family transcriptional repressor of mexJK operon
MSTELPRKTVREGQAHKRESILAAARDLFVQSGVDRTSMDAVAARASVSKRTVYDYYGDKHGLLIGVVENAGESALAILREATTKYLSDGLAIDSPKELERALTEFAEALGASLLTSSNYVAAVKRCFLNSRTTPLRLLSRMLFLNACSTSPGSDYLKQSIRGLQPNTSRPSPRYGY